MTLWGGGLHQMGEIRLLQTTETQRQRQRHIRGKKSVKAGELGYENDPHIMRINNHICSWPFSLLFFPESN